MRRKDREITDFNEIIEIIRKCDCCRLAFNDKDFPYIVPLNFGLHVDGDKVELYFHCAKEGTKLDLIRQDNIGHGTIEFVPDEDKFDALKILMAQYHEEDFKFNTDMMKVTTVFKLVVSDMTGKRRNNVH